MKSLHVYILVVLGVCSAGFGQNLLLNPSFEGQTLDNWVRKDLALQNQWDFPAAEAQDGTYAARFTDSGTGARPNGALTQEVTFGTPYTGNLVFSGYVKRAIFDAGAVLQPSWGWGATALYVNGQHGSVPATVVPVNTSANNQWIFFSNTTYVTNASTVDIALGWGLNGSGTAGTRSADIVLLDGWSLSTSPNLLVNPNFSIASSTFTSCGVGGPTIAANGGAVQNGWSASGESLKQNGSIFVPNVCPSTGANDPDTDGKHGSIDTGGSQDLMFWQTVTLASPANGTDEYAFTGIYAGGSQDAGDTVDFKLVAGSDPNAAHITGAIDTRSGLSDQFWTSFSATGTPTAGTTQLTVVAKVNHGSGVVGLHVDSVSLAKVIVPCTAQPTVTDVSPELLVREDTNVQVTITGTNFDVGGSPTVRLLGPGGATLDADSVIVNSSTQATATFNLIPASLPHGPGYALEYNPEDACNPFTLGDAVVLVLPAFTNGSFDVDNVGQCVATDNGNTPPTDWKRQSVNFWNGSDILTFNGWFNAKDGGEGPLDFLPTCPQDGPNFATIANNDGSENEQAYAYQIVEVTPGATYTFSGYFAGSGGLEVWITLQDGPPIFSQSPANFIAQTLVNDAFGTYDWRYATVTGTAGGTGVMSVVWHARAINDDLDENASHADGLTFSECPSPGITLSGISPGDAVNSGTANVTITGSGFSGTPSVVLSKPGVTIIAGSVQTNGPSELTCELDLTGAPSGRYDVIVQQGGCTAVLEGVSGFLVVAENLINGSFEEPFIAETCQGRVPGVPAGWNFTSTGDASLSRDDLVGTGSLTCPNPTDGGHFGAITGTSASGTAWQAVQVVPGLPYIFSGEFAGGPGGDTNAQITLRLRDANETGTEIASQVIPLASGDTWYIGSVEGEATSDVLIVEWDGVLTGGAGVKADGLTLVPGIGCNNPRPDSDGDGDVDQRDFAVLQLCLSIIPYDSQATVLGYECGCMDLNGSGSLTTVDFNAFINCADGPNVPANPACDD